MRCDFAIALSVGVCLLATAADASDGAIEINQTTALAGSVNGDPVADPPGFPVVITQPGSYVVTGILTVPDLDTTAISISANHVSLDLNGFGIEGPGTCTAAACSSGAGDGIASAGFASDIKVKNGFVHGVGDRGIFVASFGLVKNVSISEVGGTGIETLGASVIVENQISSVGGDGMNIQLFQPGLETRSVYRDNVIIGVGLGAGGGRGVVGGLATGGNYCGDGSCSPRGRRRFYLTDDPVLVMGNQALSTCADGFHMASMWEIRDVSSLYYDTQLGITPTFGDQGPPQGFDSFGTGRIGGWIRTAVTVSALSSNTAGDANCFGWMASNPSLANGTFAALPFDWEDATTTQVDPWETSTRGCDEKKRVWCVED